jgi:hypothetical protein
MDQIDSLKAKHDAAEQAKKALAQSGIYGQQSYQTREYNRDGDDDNDNDRSGNRGYGGRDNNNDDSYGNNERSNRGEGYGSNESGAYGSGGAGQYGSGGIGGGRGDNDNEYRRSNNTDSGENKGYYNKEGGAGEGFSGRSRGDNDNEYGRENQGNEYGSRNNEYGSENRYVFASLSVNFGAWLLILDVPLLLTVVAKAAVKGTAATGPTTTRSPLDSLTRFWSFVRPRSKQNAEESSSCMTCSR